MKKRFCCLHGFLIVTLLIASCSTVPVTGRRQLNLISDSTVLPMSAQQYEEFLSSQKIIRNTGEAAMVERVGRGIQDAVERYFAEQKMSEGLRGYTWEFNLVESKEVNAWCMPGGKVVVYSGILPVAGDEAGLAVVMGHEIAHAIAKHGNERMSQALVTQLGGTALSVALESVPGTNSGPLDGRLRCRVAGGRPAPLQPSSGKRGGPPRPHLHGHGRL